VIKGKINNLDTYCEWVEEGRTTLIMLWRGQLSTSPVSMSLNAPYSKEFTQWKVRGKLCLYLIKYHTVKRYDGVEA
jgi:hypothetical protein